MNKTATFLRAAALTRVPWRGKAYTGPLKGSMNDLPQPCGSWQTNYDAKQRKYNGHLIMGLGFLFVTLVFGHLSGSFYMNYYPPDRPLDKNDYNYDED